MYIGVLIQSHLVIPRSSGGIFWDRDITGLKIASDWSPWATKNRPRRLEIMIQEPIGELHIGPSATAVDPIPFFISMSR